MDLIQRLVNGIRYWCIDYWQEIADPRTKDLPLIKGGPETVLGILLVYLLFVKFIGPWFMKNRKPYKLFGPMLAYNIFMVIVNSVLFYFSILRMDYGRRFLNFKFPDRNDFSPTTLWEIQTGYLCYLIRFLDLIDTIFFVLRKKNNQITFLHLYHHTIVPIIGYMTLKVAPQAPVALLFILLNSFIHSVMYLYYALSAFGPKIQPYLWWKKYITQLQLIQFAICGVYGIIMVFLQEGFPPVLFWLGFAQNPFFFYMFYDFYQKAYHHQSKIKNGLQQNAINGESTKKIQ